MLLPNLRGKRFRLVLDQRKTEEPDFRVWSSETLHFFLTPSPLFYSHHFFFLVPRSSLRNRRESLGTKASCPLLQETFRYIVKILYFMSPPSEKDNFGTGIKCSSDGGVCRLESQVKTVKKDRGQL